MSKYVLGHHLEGEGTRLDLMSELLDPMHRRCIEALEIVKPGARTLEVGIVGIVVVYRIRLRMSKYVLGHHLEGEGTRLDLMSELLDPMWRGRGNEASITTSDAVSRSDWQR